MSIYENIDKEKAASDFGAFARAGHYLALIHRLRSGNSTRHGCGVASVDMSVVHTFPDGDVPMIAPEQPKKWVPDPKSFHKPGEQISACFLAKNQSAKRNLKAFLARALEEDENEITPTICTKIETENLLEGTVIELTNRMVQKSNDGGPFTKIWVARVVKAEEYSKLIAPDIAQRFFPKGFDALIKAGV